MLNFILWWTVLSPPQQHFASSLDNNFSSTILLIYTLVLHYSILLIVNEYVILIYFLISHRCKLLFFLCCRLPGGPVRCPLLLFRNVGQHLFPSGLFLALVCRRRRSISAGRCSRKLPGFLQLSTSARFLAGLPGFLFCGTKNMCIRLIVRWKRLWMKKLREKLLAFSCYCWLFSDLLFKPIKYRFIIMNRVTPKFLPIVFNFIPVHATPKIVTFEHYGT